MSINTTLNSGEKQITISVSGRFDFSQHQDFRAAFDPVPEEIKKFVIDLRTTEYIDSSALGMLLILRDKVESRTGTIEITNANSSVKNILEIAKFNTLFSVT